MHLTKRTCCVIKQLAILYCPRFLFSTLFVDFLLKKIYLPVSENVLKSICGKYLKISSFTCSLFIVGGFQKNKNTFLPGFILGKSDIILIGSPRPFPLAAVTEKGQVIRLTSFIHTEVLGSFGTIFQHYHLSTFSMSFAMQNPRGLFILCFVLKSEATEGLFQNRKNILDFIQVA